MKETTSKIKDFISDPSALSYELRKRKKDLTFWVIGLILMIVVFIFFSSKDFSFILVISSLTQTLSFVIILIKVASNQNTSGLSLHTIVSYTIVLVARLSSTLFYDGYLPSDAAGDWLYQFAELISVGSLILLVLLITVKYNDTYNSEFDTIQWPYLAGPCLFLALLCHTTLNNNFFTDMMWSFSMYLEGVAIFPQIYLFKEKKGQIESFTSHYVSLQGLSRLCSLIFWYHTYSELHDGRDESGFSLFPGLVGYLIMLSQIIQLLIMLDYFYFYFKSLFKGEELVITEI
jgi:hypothetical protein